eukprot:3138073-Prorocentrum_lima.AAC.1
MNLQRFAAGHFNGEYLGSSPDTPARRAVNTNIGWLGRGCYKWIAADPDSSALEGFLDALWMW